MKNTHRVYVKNADGTETFKASGKLEFCNIVAANHKRNGSDAVVRPIPEEDLK